MTKPYSQPSEEWLRKMAELEDQYVGPGVMAISPELLRMGNKLINHCQGCICESCTHAAVLNFGEIARCTKCGNDSAGHAPLS